jgi:transposase-like protein
MDNIIWKTKTRTEVAMEYGIDRKTLYRWLKKTNILISKGLITPGELEKIYTEFGDPKSPKKPQNTP